LGGTFAILIVAFVVVLFYLRARKRARTNKQINIDDMQQHRQAFSPQPSIPQVVQIQYENEAFTPQSPPSPFQPQRRPLHSPFEGYYQPSPIRTASFPSATPSSGTLHATSATEEMRGTPTNIKIGARSPSLSLSPSPPPPTYED